MGDNNESPFDPKCRRYLLATLADEFCLCHSHCTKIFEAKVLNKKFCVLNPYWLILAKAKIWTNFSSFFRSYPLTGNSWNILRSPSWNVLCTVFLFYEKKFSRIVRSAYWNFFFERLREKKRRKKRILRSKSMWSLVPLISY